MSYLRQFLVLSFTSQIVLLRALVLTGVAVSLLACGSHVHHRVERGETLYKIGWQYGQDYQTIAQWNDISAPYNIHEGQWLRVAPPDGRTESRIIDNKSVAKSLKNNSQKSTSKISEMKADDISHLRVFANKPVENVSQWQWPTKGTIIHSFSKTQKGKKGIDIVGKKGQAILAAAEGEVVYSGNGLVGLGNLIIVKHNKTFLSAYAHSDKIMVTEGQRVTRGQQIATMGDTGTERVLLHFEIRKNGIPVDPLKYLAGVSP